MSSIEPNAQPLVARGQAPGVDGEIAARQQVAQVGHVDAVSRDHVRIEKDADLAGVNTLQFDARNAVDTLEPALEEAIQQVVTVGQVPFARDSQLQYWLVTQRPGENEDPANVVGQPMTDTVDLGTGLDTFRAHVLVPVELQEYLRVALGGCREHLLHAGQGSEGFFHRPRDQPLDFLRRRTLVRDLDEDPGKLDVGKFLERQETGRDQPYQRQRDEDDHGGDRSP